MIVSCADKQAQEAGQKAATSFKTAWEQGIAQADSSYKAWLDSIEGDGALKDFNEAFLAEVEAAGNDTLTCAAMLLALQEEDLADRTAQPIVDGLLSGEMDRETAQGRIQLIHYLTQELNKPDVATGWDARIEAMVKDLSVAKQMKVYAAASSPEDLAAALLNDAQQPGADLKLIEQQVAALSDIYTAEEMKRFNDAYNQVGKK